MRNIKNWPELVSNLAYFNYYVHFLLISESSEWNWNLDPQMYWVELILRFRCRTFTKLFKDGILPFCTENHLLVQVANLIFCHDFQFSERDTYCSCFSLCQVSRILMNASLRAIVSTDAVPSRNVDAYPMWSELLLFPVANGNDR